MWEIFDQSLINAMIVVGKQHKCYITHSKSALLENAINEIENHIIEDII